MQSNVISKLINYKQDPVFEAAKDIIRQFSEKLDDPTKDVKLKLPIANQVYVYPKEKKVSPVLRCFGEDSQIILISFPPNSKPYEDHITQDVKNCLILEGTIYNANDPTFKMVMGDKFKVYPWDNIAPYTKDTPAVALVTLQK